MATWQVKPGLEYRRLGDEGIILDPETGLFYRLDPDAAAEWEEIHRTMICHDSPIFQEFLALGLLSQVGGHRPELPGSPTIRVEAAEVALAAPAKNCTVYKTKPTCIAVTGCTWNSSRNKCQ